jgi:glycosyltransferase
MPPARRLADYGAAITLGPGADGPGDIAKACDAVLTTPAYTARARDLATEISALPTPPQVIKAVEELSSRRTD